MKKLTILIFTLITLIGCTSATANNQVAAATFTDIQGHWSQADVELAVSKGYVNGYEDGSFRPEGTVTRAEFVKMTVSALELTVSGETTGSNWYLPFVNAAVYAEIHAEADFSTGDWNTPITRLEMARMAVRATGEDTEEDLKWMYLATSAGLIKGTDLTGTLDVDGTTTRAQAVTIIERILSIQAGETLEAQIQAVSRAEVLWRKTNIFTVMPQFFGDGNQPYATWDPDEMFIETPDGKWRGEMDALVVIDLEDPHDPFLSLLPPLDEIRWNDLTGDYGVSIKGYENSYILFGDQRVVFNHDTGIYREGRTGWLQLSIGGRVNADMDRFRAGDLHTMTGLYHNNRTPINGWIIPKQVQTRGALAINISAPSIPNHQKTLLQVHTPEWIGREE